MFFIFSIFFYTLIIIIFSNYLSIPYAFMFCVIYIALVIWWFLDLLVEALFLCCIYKQFYDLNLRISILQ